MTSSSPCTSELRSACSALISAAGFAGDFRLHQLDGGVNNRVFRVEMDGRQLLLKHYFSHPDDSRDRLTAEYSFARFAWQNGIRALPQPIAASRSNGLALYEFVEGRRFTSAQITGDHIQAALDFYRELNQSKQHPDSKNLPNASEACFSLIEHLTRVEHRVKDLCEIAPMPAVHQDALRFVQRELVPKWSKVTETVQTDARRRNLPLDDQLDRVDRCLSPSDFGFHNAILDNRGTIRFFDFEYAGWDDPAKTVCDFFCQVEVPVPREYFADFTESVSALQQRPEELQRRIRLLFPVYQLKWCCILLNEFMPTSIARRQFSQGAGDVDRRKEEQLVKAGQVLAGLTGIPPI